jgi:hypothetical protein
MYFFSAQKSHLQVSKGECTPNPEDGNVLTPPKSQANAANFIDSENCLQGLRGIPVMDTSKVKNNKQKRSRTIAA